jgi:hypothetical protein
MGSGPTNGFRPASEDVKLGIGLGTFQLRDDQVAVAVAMMSASVLAAISLVLEGQRTWRDPGTDAAELFLRALGVPREEAQVIAGAELPVLSAADTS